MKLRDAKPRLIKLIISKIHKSSMNLNLSSSSSRAGRFGLPGVGKQATPGWGGVTGPQLGVRSTILGPHHDIQIQVVTQPQRGVR